MTVFDEVSVAYSPVRADFPAGAVAHARIAGCPEGRRLRALTYLCAAFVWWLALNERYDVPMRTLVPAVNAVRQSAVPVQGSQAAW